MAKTIGIIGGGQLGRMLIQAGINYPINFHIYSDSLNFSSQNFCKKCLIGDLNDYHKIIKFGKECDIITIEIENVNTSALKYLRDELNKKVYPNPELLEMIKNRKSQKDFLKKNNIPTLNYIYYSNLSDINSPLQYPCVNKLCIGGYDGYGTKIIKSNNDQLFPHDSIIEEYCPLDRELSVIIARNSFNQIIIYPPVEMVFNNQNMLDYLICPAENIDLQKINSIATKIAKKSQLIGILAIELFESKGEIYVNEMAPRPHNSGHHTQEMFDNSQFDILIKCLLDLPLQKPLQLSNYAACINILGNSTIDSDNVSYNLNEINNISSIYLHLYQKYQHRPYRKLGHLNILANNKKDLLNKIEIIKIKLKDFIYPINELEDKNPIIGIIMGSISDLNIMQSAINTLKEFKINYEIKIVSAHRTPEMMLEYGKNAEDRGLKIIIAGAGGAAHLPGMIASCTSLPVIGVPIKSSNSIDGWDSILSILQMPNGIPVATVNLNGSQNAALLAVRILGHTDKIDEYREKLKNKVQEMNDKL